MARLAGLLPGTEVTTTDEAGISGDDMEALAFAACGVPLPGYRGICPQSPAHAKPTFSVPFSRPIPS